MGMAMPEHPVQPSTKQDTKQQKTAQGEKVHNDSCKESWTKAMHPETWNNQRREVYHERIYDKGKDAKCEYGYGKGQKEECWPYETVYEAKYQGSHKKGGWTFGLYSPDNLCGDPKPQGCY